MGMYAYFIGPADKEVELKLTGLLETAVNSVYPDAIVYGSCELSYDMVLNVVTVMGRYFADGISVFEGGNIIGQSVYRLAADADAMALLVDWLHFNSGNKLTSSIYFT